LAFFHAADPRSGRAAWSAEGLQIQSPNGDKVP
jgi:hypothetical protein